MYIYMFYGSIFFQKCLGYTPKVRMLKPDVVPTLHLPPDHSQNVTSTAAINRNKRNEMKLRKQVNFKF
jgi:hypothetical protein